jgi:hypothetical protein
MAADPITGNTIRWTYDDGPMKGRTFEHRFANDGTVSWREVDGSAGSGANAGNGSAEVPSAKYEYARINDDVYAISYLSGSGFTLTTIVDGPSGGIVSVASNEKELVIQHGRLAGAMRSA